MDHVGEGESVLVFEPTDEELVLNLLNKVTGQTPSMREVIECDLYGDEELWRKRFEGTQLNCLYFFTKLKKTSQKMTRSNRATAWCNTWKAQSDRKICVGEKHIGSRRSFSLVEKDKPGDKLRWVMHEYRLDGVYDCHNQGNDYVICRIRRRVSKKVAVKRQVVEGDNAMAIQTNGIEILDPMLGVLKDQEMETPGSYSPQKDQDDVLGQQEATQPPTVDSYSSFYSEGGDDDDDDDDDYGGNTSWVETFAQHLLANAQNFVEEEEGEADLLPNQFYQHNWVRGWERADS